MNRGYDEFESCGCGLYDDNDYDYDYDYDFDYDHDHHKGRKKRKANCKGCICEYLKRNAPVDLQALQINGLLAPAVGEVFGNETVSSIKALCFKEKACCLTIVVTFENGAIAPLTFEVMCKDIEAAFVLP